MRTLNTRIAAVGLALALSIGVAACGSSDSDSSAPKKSATTQTTEMSTTSADSSTDMMQPSGPGCTAVPKSGSGSFAGMAQDPAATAASNNPLLSTLVTAGSKAGQVDTLNGPGPFTIFAPTNDAFAKIPTATLNQVLADKATLTKILTLHVVSGEKMSSDDLVAAGSVDSIEGDSLKITKDGDTLMVNDAKVLCMDVPPANATVYIIDSVLMPS